MPPESRIYHHPNANAEWNKTGRANAVQVRCTVYTPPGFHNENGGSYPVLYLLHGVGDSEKSWELQGKVPTIVGGLLKDASIQPIVVVMPFGFESNEQQSRKEFPSKDWFDRYMTRVIDEAEREYKIQVPTTADTRSSKRAIAGLSMGGKQSLEFGLGHLELFYAIGNFSGAIQTRRNHDPLPDLLAVCKAKQAQLKGLALFYHAWGRDDDHRLIDANRKLVRELESLGICPQWDEMDGKHEWAVWKACLKKFLTLLGKEWRKSE